MTTRSQGSKAKNQPVTLNIASAFYPDKSAKGAFRLKGEQLDGSFLLNNDTYLVEAKWHSTKTGNADLYAFHGKLDQKISWARGVFISWEGFTRSGLDAVRDLMQLHLPAEL